MGAAVTLSHYKGKREKIKTPKFIYNLSAALQLFILANTLFNKGLRHFFFLLNSQCFCNLKGIAHPNNM